jgi:hypothetical protein
LEGIKPERSGISDFAAGTSLIFSSTEGVTQLPWVCGPLGMADTAALLIVGDAIDFKSSFSIFLPRRNFLTNWCALRIVRCPVQEALDLSSKLIRQRPGFTLAASYSGGLKAGNLYFTHVWLHKVLIGCHQLPPIALVPAVRGRV